MITIKEIWKPLVYNIENSISLIYSKYEVSNYGRVKNHNNKIMKPWRNIKGYYWVSLFINGKKKSFSVARLVIMTFASEGIINSDALQVNHKIKDLNNNYLQNLEWSTKGENSRHKYDYEDKSIFTESQIHSICEMMEIENWTYKSILLKFGMTKKSHMKEYRRLMKLYKDKSYTDIRSKYNIVKKGIEEKDSNYILTKDLAIEAITLMQKPMWTFESICMDLKIPDKYKDIFKKLLSDIYRKKLYKNLSKDIIFENITITSKMGKVLKENDIHEICKAIVSGEKNLFITKHFDISETTLLNIKKKRTHVKISDLYFKKGEF